ncbi:MAG TPA: glycosyltransferase [Candidatus Bathyarchaeia archaeon]
MKISAVIPVYNEEEVIDEFSGRLLESLKETADDYEIVFVVEGEDKTMEKLREFSSVNPNVKLDYNQRRLGLGKAMKRGLSLVSHRTDYVLTMDPDLNHRPEEIGRLLEAAADADIIVGCRSLSHGMVGELPLFRRVVSGTTNWLLRKAFRIPSSDVTSGFRLYSATAVESIRDELTSTNFEVTAELLIRAKRKGLTIAEVPITFTPRPRGNSKLSLVRSGIGYAKLLARLGL